jgi:hypothetical protein
MAKSKTPRDISDAAGMSTLKVHPHAGFLSRLDQAMQITRCVGSTIPEDSEHGSDRRAAIMGVATLIEGIYHDVSEVANG